MDWTRAIATHAAALTRILREILALMDHVLEPGASRLPRVFHSEVLRQLRPAEAALRRLIVVMARDLKVTLPPRRAMPKGVQFRAQGEGRRRFQLHDPRKRRLVPAPPQARARALPRIHVFGPSPLVPLFAEKPPVKAAAPKGTVSAAALRQRVAAFKAALGNLPREAKRLARWRLRRAAQPSARFTQALRPGPPPGHQRRPRFKVDRVLAACHGLAFEALRVNSS